MTEDQGIETQAERADLPAREGVEAAQLEMLKLEKIRLLEEKKRLYDLLPHRYGFKRYPWQDEFFTCYEQDAFLTAANQVGKSTIMIATVVEWAGNKALWSRLFKRREPRQFWYLYPSLDFATSEFEMKWVPDLLPRGEMKNDPVWGWKATYQGKYIHSIKFNSGVTLYFKAYTQDVMNLQGSTVDAIFCDEELPEDFWDELNWRRNAVKGYFRMAFTATIGQKLWYDTMERKGTPEEKFPHAWKKQISLYDCMKFTDGTPSHIDEEYIQKAKMLCKSKAEELKRVWGRFATDSGLKYPTFDKELNVSAPTPIARNWPIYIGVDIGSGGDEGHPSAVVFVAVSPDYTKAIAFDGWLGTDRVTTDIDVYNRMMEMIWENGLEDRIAGIFYDYHAKDFGTICGRNGLSVEKADKSHDTGEAVLGVLFKTLNLSIQSKPCLDVLVFQLSNLKRDTPKKHAVDDFADGLRYAVTRIPFDWGKIGVKINTVQKAVVERVNPEEENLRKRREQYMKANFDSAEDKIIDVTTEMEAWSDLYEF